MKIILKSLLVLSLIFVSFSGVDAFRLCEIDDSCGDGKINIDCGESECNLQGGIDQVKGALGDGQETDKTISEYVQSVVVYALTFVSIIAVIYIIYAGFMILTGAGDEEKLKKSKQTILYVIIGIVLIWLAYPITIFILNILSVGDTAPINTVP